MRSIQLSNMIKKSMHEKSVDVKISKDQRTEAIFFGVTAPLVIFHGPNHVYEMLNETYQNIYPSRELLGKPFLEAVPELKETIYPHILKQVYETGEPYVTHEGMAKIFNQSTGEFDERYFDTTFSRINYNDGKDFRIIASPREVTERVRYRKQLEASLGELKAERELRERFISALTHDLRTPLAIVKIGAQVLKRKPHDQTAVIEMADRFTLSMDRADRMIRDLLDANRIKAGKGLPITVSACRMDLILEYVLKDLEELYGKRFSVIFHASSIDGFWDNMAIHRLVENLASNAIKYGAPLKEVTISLDANSDWVEIGVHNEGNPISMEDQRMLFQEFSRSDTAIESGQRGWGIGLALVRGLVEAHGGTVRVMSDDSHGTTFFARLPRDSRAGKIN
jgi:signal transduction histidine kinase